MMRKCNFIKQTEGAAAIMIAISLVVLIGVASLAIDVGQLYSVRNQLQNVADAAALAGAGQMIQMDSTTNNAVWRSDLAKAAALKVAQDQGVLDGLAAVADGARNDLILRFGVWDLYVADHSLAWTDRGTSLGSTSDANAFRVTITRGTGTIFGPVTSLFAQALGYPTTTVGASATAYLGDTSGVPTGAVQVPLALPSTGPYSPLASNGNSGWFASLFGPGDAVASAVKTIKFRDTGGATVASSVPTSPVAALDSNQGYFYTPLANPTYNTVPDTVKNIIKKIYTPSLTGTDKVPVLLPDLKVGQQIYPASEYPWGSSNMKPIFDNLKAAYTAKKNANGKWRTTVVVHGLKSTASLPGKAGFRSLARLLVPFWASEAYACATIAPPAIVVRTFANVDITAVSAATGDDGSYTYPKTIATPVPTIPNPISGKPITTYNDKKDFLNRYPNSTWNVNTVTIQSVTDASTVSPSGSRPGGLPNNASNPGAPLSVGPKSTTALLVK